MAAGVGEVEFTFVGGVHDGLAAGQFHLNILSKNMRSGTTIPYEGDAYTLLHKPYRGEIRWLMVHPNAIKMYAEGSK